MTHAYRDASVAGRFRFAALRLVGQAIRMKDLALAAMLLLTACATAPAQAQTASCLPVAGYGRDELDALKAAEWALPDEAARNRLALVLAPCVADPDPAVRDGIAFEAYAHWLRSRALSAETMRALVADLRPRLQASEGAGFERPFAALVLSELARADRIEPYLSEAERTGLLEASVHYITGIRDYRGFDAREGWRHGVAHGADLLLQLALNPALGRADLVRIRDAVGAQIAPAGHVYTFGESERLARPILYMARRNVFTSGEWTAWFAELTGEENAWQGAFASPDKLARRHNLTAFASAIYINADLDSEDLYGALVPGATAMLQAMP
jgi:hypothetical protein